MAEHLFETRYGRICFVVVQDEMSGIDALLNGIAVSSSHAVRDLEEQRRRILAGEKIHHNSLGDVTHDVLDSLEHYFLPHARSIQESLSAIASFMLLFAFFERALRVIAEDLAKDASEVERYIKRNRQLGKIRAYMAFLHEEVSLEFEVPLAVDNMLDRERRLRNCFAHGEWDIVDKLPHDSRPENSLSAMKRLFDALEDAVEVRDA